jgi:hypothetical protein
MKNGISGSLRRLFSSRITTACALIAGCGEGNRATSPSGRFVKDRSLHTHKKPAERSLFFHDLDPKQKFTPTTSPYPTSLQIGCGYLQLGKYFTFPPKRKQRKLFKWQD